MLSCRIAQLRRRTGLSQSQLAHQLHISPSALGMYEQGRRTPSLEILVQMSRIFNVSLDYLITGSEFLPASRDKTRSNSICLCPFHSCHRQRISDDPQVISKTHFP